MKLLKQLCEIQAPSGDERPLKDFLLSYVTRRSKTWKVKPEIFHGPDFQDCIVLKFGHPRTAIYAHMDSIGFMVRYENQLLPVGSPEAEPGTLLVGADRHGPIECTLEFDKDHHAFYRFGRPIERGTYLTYKIDYRDTPEHITSAYLDNRLGVYSALQIASELTNGLICFSCWEEHGGGSVPMLARFAYEHWRVRQSLVLDITWATDGVHLGQGVAISMRDRNLPRRQFIDRIVSLAAESKIPHQLEVEGMGSSDGRELQMAPYPIDWAFVGAPELFPHTPAEKVHKKDIESMIALYRLLMDRL